MLGNYNTYVLTRSSQRDIYQKHAIDNFMFTHEEHLIRVLEKLIQDGLPHVTHRHAMAKPKVTLDENEST